MGVSDHPQLEMIFFVGILFSYLLTLFGNSAIILLSILMPSPHTHVLFLSNPLSLDLAFTTSSVPPNADQLVGSRQDYQLWWLCDPALCFPSG